MSGSPNKGCVIIGSTPPRLAGVDIKGIAASHSDSPPSKDGYNTDYIYIIDIEGLRIVHFGDMEQSALTTEQLEELQNIDVAFAEFWADPTNKYFNVMDQVKPKMIIPTHLGDRRALKTATEKWPSFQIVEKEITIKLRWKIYLVRPFS